MVMVVIMAVVMVAGVASAALLGIGKYMNNLPRIQFDSTGTITYDATNNLFTLTAIDNKLILPDGTEITLYDTDDSSVNLKTELRIQIYVDSSGNKTGGVTDYDMVEKVTVGSVTINGVTYNAGDVLLQAEVKAFGWGYITDIYGNTYPVVEFLFDPISGGLVNQSLWPSPTPLTALWAHGAPRYTFNWSNDFEILGIEGKKFPTPEPATLLLLGTGLIGIAQLGRKKLRKK